MTTFHLTLTVDETDEREPRRAMEYALRAVCTGHVGPIRDHDGHEYGTLTIERDMAFEAFQASRVYGNFATLVPEADWQGYDDPKGYVYTRHHYQIVDVGHPDGRYELVLGNECWLTDDLAALERRLYEWARDEGGLA